MWQNRVLGLDPGLNSPKHGKNTGKSNLYFFTKFSVASGALAGVLSWINFSESSGLSAGYLTGVFILLVLVVIPL